MSRRIVRQTTRPARPLATVRVATVRVATVRVAAVWVAALCVAACAPLGPDYQRPQSPLPDHFAGDATTTGSAPGAPLQGEWWQLFGDATLDRLVTTALRDNWDVRQAAARVEEAQAVLRQAGAALLPEVDASGDVSRSHLSQQTDFHYPSSVAAAHSDFLGQLGVSYELDFWGRLRRADEAARATALGTRFGRDTVALSQAALVVQGYLGLRGLDAQLAVSHESLSNREANLRLVQDRFRGGLATELDVRQAEGAVAALQAQVAELGLQRALAQHQLALLTATPNLELEAGDLRGLPVPPTPPAGLPSSLLEERPDIRQAETDLIAANARIGVARAALYPDITLTAALGHESAQLAQLFTGSATFWSVTPAFTVPLFDAGRRAGVVEQATAQQAQALAAYRRSVERAFSEVNDALAAVAWRADQESALERQLGAATRSLELAQSRYAAGYSPFLEVLDAQRTVNDTQLAWLRNRQARLSAAVDLFRSLGGGWQSKTQ